VQQAVYKAHAQLPHTWIVAQAASMQHHLQMAAHAARMCSVITSKLFASAPLTHANSVMLQEYQSALSAANGGITPRLEAAIEAMHTHDAWQVGEAGGSVLQPTTHNAARHSAALPGWCQQVTGHAHATQCGHG
jgi:hypothetical protein